MRTPTARQKPRKAQTALFQAPSAGWIANRNLSMPSATQAKLPPGATILENWFPTTTGARLRRGSRRWATLGTGSERTTAMFTYNVGQQQQLFAATQSAIWDISVVTSPYNYVYPVWVVLTDIFGNILVDANGDVIYVLDDGTSPGSGEESTGGLEVLIGQSGGDWVVVQSTNSDGGVHLRGVNGVDTPFVYDGASFTTTPALTFASPDPSEPEDLTYVWSFKRRLFFVKKDSLDAYYLPVDAIGGELALLPLGAVFSLGGYLMFGSSWSLGSSDAGGMGAQCVFITSEGEVAVYQGTNPDDPADWSLVGVYRIGKPLGPKAHISAGGDIVIATTVGFMPLSEAVAREYAALSPAAVSNPIEDAWRDAVQSRVSEPWTAVTWPDGQMVVVAPPPTTTEVPRQFVVNANTGAWCKFTGWTIRCMAVFRGSLYFGGNDGAVTQAWIGGDDDGAAYSARFLGLFEDGGTPASRKIAGMARATVTASVDIRPKVSVHFDFRENLPHPESSPEVSVDGVWDGGTWDLTQWDSESDSVISSRWVSVGGSGARMAPAVQISSGSVLPIDALLTAVDITYTLSDIAT